MGEGSPVDPIDRTAKMYVGGKQARPDGGYSKPVWGKSGLLGHVGLANRKDVRNAVEAAAGATNWSKTTGHLRAQILYYIGENLSARADEFAHRIDAMTGRKDGAKEVDAAIQRVANIFGFIGKEKLAAKSIDVAPRALSATEGRPADCQLVMLDRVEHAQAGVRTVSRQQNHFNASTRGQTVIQAE